MNRQVIRFTPNESQTLALEFPEGVNVRSKFGDHEIRFILTENRVIYLEPEAAQAIRILDPAPGELFTLVKRTEPGKRPWWEAERIQKGGDAGDRTVTEAARRSGAFQAIRAANPPSPTAPTPKIEPSPVSAANPAISEAVQPRIPAQQAHTIPPPSRGIQLTRTPPLKPSYEEAFRECLRIVREGLHDAGEAWSDHSVQAMTSTLFIQAAREGTMRFTVPQNTEKVA